MLGLEAMERTRIIDKRFCVDCGSDKTRIKKNRGPIWYNHNGNFRCSRCQDKLVYNPNRTKEAIKKYNDRNNRKVLVFRGHRILLKDNPRKGVCSWCHKKIGDEYTDYYGKVRKIKSTNLHHLEYHDDNILKDTIELCASCHGKESIRIKKIVEVAAGD